MHQPHTLRVFLNLVTALAVVGVFVTAWAVRKRRRQQKHVEELLRSGS